MRTTVSISGFAGLEAQLAKLTKATGRSALRKAGRAALEPTARLARSMAPEDTGELIESIDVSAKAQGSGAGFGRQAYAQAMGGGLGVAAAVAAIRGARRGAGSGDGPPSIVLHMGPEKAATKDEAIKAWVQEFGSSDQAPQSYMRPAWDQDQGQILDRLKKELWFEVSSAVVKAQARAAKAGRG